MFGSTLKSVAVCGVSAIALSACTPTTQMAVPTVAAVEKETTFQQDLVRSGMASLPRVSAAGSSVSSDHEVRTFVLGNRILIGGSALCGAKVIKAMPFGVRLEGDALRVMWSVDIDDEADGLKTGDIIKGMDGVPVEPGRRGTRAALSTMSEVAKGNRALKVDIERDGKPMNLEINPAAACDYPIEYSAQDVFNAYADGKKIMMFRGLARRMDDDELAGVIAHELAHNIMGHVASNRGNALLGALIGAAVGAAVGMDDEQTDYMADEGAALGANSFSAAFESEADYVGTYILARSGFDYEAMPDVMRKLANPDNLTARFSQTHPPTPQRAAAAEATIDEIKRKMAQGLPLMPEVKASATKKK
jgi:hypothetical protein